MSQLLKIEQHQRQISRNSCSNYDHKNITTEKILPICLVQIIKDKTVMMTFRVNLLKPFDDDFSKQMCDIYPKAIIV